MKQKPTKPAHLPIPIDHVAQIRLYVALSEQCAQSVRLSCARSGLDWRHTAEEMADRLNLEAGDEVFLVDTGQVILITAYDPTFEHAIAAYNSTFSEWRH